MQKKLTLAVVALVLAPGLASAMCSRDHDKAMTCAEGSVYNPETGSCVPQTTS
ncbi:MAG: Chitin binding Peritrophin-A domain [Rhodobacteraceae bacterium HLUCCO07]|uniref:carbohydrate-binding module family 14 protein n=1 Tax=Aquicoccus sp. TaxID=2055851 RepID=UPI0006DB30B1|nr:MAG: Chitin binding Peritrophin-A domain [Rhodobacteraceae bacterium HLUCCO07]